MGSAAISFLISFITALIRRRYKDCELLADLSDPDAPGYAQIASMGKVTGGTRLAIPATWLSNQRQCGGCE